MEFGSPSRPPRQYAQSQSQSQSQNAGQRPRRQQRGRRAATGVSQVQPPRQQRQNGRVGRGVRSSESAGSTRPPPGGRHCGPTNSDSSTDCDEVLCPPTTRDQEPESSVVAEEGDTGSVYAGRLRQRNPTWKKSTKYGADFFTDHEFEFYVKESKPSSKRQLIPWGRKKSRTRGWSSLAAIDKESDPERTTNSDDFPEGRAAMAAQGEARPCDGSWVSASPSSDHGDGDWQPSEDTGSFAPGGLNTLRVNGPGIKLVNMPPSKKRVGEILHDHLPENQRRGPPRQSPCHNGEREVSGPQLVVELACSSPPAIPPAIIDPRYPEQFMIGMNHGLECMDQFVVGTFPASLANGFGTAERPEPSQNQSRLRDVVAAAPRDGFAAAVPNGHSFSDAGSADSAPQSSGDDYIPPNNLNGGIPDNAGTTIFNSVSNSRRPRRNVALVHDDVSRRTDLPLSNPGAIDVALPSLPENPTRGFSLNGTGIYACRTPIPFPGDSSAHAKILSARGNVELGQPSNGTTAPNSVEEPNGKPLFDLNEIPQEQPATQTLPPPRKKLRPKVTREGRPYKARKPKDANGGAPKPKPPPKPRAKPGPKATGITKKRAPRKKGAAAASRLADDAPPDNHGAINAAQFQGHTLAPPSSEELLLNREESVLSLPPRPQTPVHEALHEMAAHGSPSCGYFDGGNIRWQHPTWDSRTQRAAILSAQTSLRDRADNQKVLPAQAITKTARKELFRKPPGKAVTVVGKEQESGLGQSCRDSPTVVSAPPLPVLDNSQAIVDPSQYARLMPLDSASVLLGPIAAEIPAEVAAITGKPKRGTRRKPAAVSKDVAMGESNPSLGRDAVAPTVKAPRRRAPGTKIAAARTTGTRRRGRQPSTMTTDDLVAHVVLKMAELRLDENPLNLQIVPHAIQQSALVPFKPKKVKLKARVLLSEEDLQLWQLVCTKGPQFAEDDPESEDSKRMQKEREIMKARAETFINRMYLVQGDRRFSIWGGSVVDSVVGAFLTQNVSDHLSSSAFMALAARFPVKKETQDAARPSQETFDQEVRVEEALEVFPNSSEGSVSGNSTADVQVIVTDPSEVCDICCTALKDVSATCCNPTDHKALSLDMKTDFGVGLDSIIHSPEGRQGHTGAIQQASEWTALSGELPVPTFEGYATGHSSSALEEGMCASPGACGATDNSPSAFGYSDAKDVPAALVPMHGRELVVELNSSGGTTSETGGGEVVQEKHHFHTEDEAAAADSPYAGILSDPFVRCQPSQDSAQSGAGVDIETFGANCLTRSSSHNFSEGEFIKPLPLKTSAPDSGDAINNHTGECSPDSNLTQIKRYIRRGKIPIRKEPLKGGRNFQDNRLENTSDMEDGITSKREKRVRKPKRLVLGAVGIARGKLEQANITSKVEFDWEAVRLKHLHAQGCENQDANVEAQASETQNINREDAVDWEAVRTATLEEIAAVIKERGMNNILAGRIKAFLQRLHTEHGSLNLEWLRKIPTKDAQKFLLSIRGLGLKSVECIRLLCLLHLAFPVDTNVGRLVVRLGWVPLEPLPDSMMLHLLELYPLQETVQKYLWPRLCNLDQKFLYELHYQMITFGKVFCTKSKPNCNACPLRDECKHFASALSHAKLPLPAPVPEEPHPESSVHLALCGPETNHEISNDQLALPDVAAECLKEVDYAVASPADAAAQAGEGPGIDLNIIYQHCDPIVEEPASPPRESLSAESVTEVHNTTDVVDLDLEQGEHVNLLGGSSQWSDASCLLHPNMEGVAQSADLVMVDEASKALVLLPLSSASLPVPKLKNVGRLRTVHYVYELPDGHPLVAEMDRREGDDPCVYLLAIWSPGETPEVLPDVHDPNTNGFCDGFNSTDAETVKGTDTETVKGTILIPCRTAMRGKFPLNGTYFQVNEVFADHASSVRPIEVPRKFLWNLRRRFVYFGTSVTSIFRGFSTEEIQACFWRGYVCVRGFDRRLRSPMPLAGRLHAPPKANKQQRRSYAEDE